MVDACGEINIGIGTFVSGLTEVSPRKDQGDTMKRLLAQRSLLIQRSLSIPTRIVLQQRRGLAWSPFRRGTVEEANENDDWDGVVIDITQELRSNPSASRLKEIASELLAASPSSTSLSLMNEVIKRVEQTSQNSVTDGTIVVTEPNDVFTMDEKLQIFTQVINHINRDNFESARFIPRLYMQLVTEIDGDKSKKLLLKTFKEFNRYLAVLGYGEQLSKVIVSFVSDHATLKFNAATQSLQVLESIEPLAPSVYVGAYEAYNYLEAGERIKSKLEELITRRTVTYIQERNELVAIESHEAEKIKLFVQTILKDSPTPAQLLNLLQIASMNDIFSQEKVHILLRFTKLLLNDAYLGELDASSLMMLLESMIDAKEISRDEVLVVGSKVVDEILRKMPQRPEKRVVVELPWSVYKSADFTEAMKRVLLDNKELATIETYNSILSALSRSEAREFDSKHKALNNFFEEYFPFLDKNLNTYEILMNKGIRERSSTLLKETFEKSITDGVDWETKPDILYKFVKVLADEPNANIEEVFGWYKKVKFFVSYLDGESYSSMMGLFLRCDYIGDAIESLKQELPELEKGSKYEVENYPSLFNTIQSWLLNDAEQIESAWDIYGELQKYFELPYDFYFPIIKKFVSMGRPDASMKVFEQMKRIHRTTGKIPPPTPEMYVYLFQNFGEWLYEDGVELLHMILKTDLHINADIDIMNSVLEAYSNLEDFKKVSDTFDQIISMPKKNGLNHRTISIMLKAYTFLSLDHVKSFWNNLDELELLPNADNFNQYIIAHCYHKKYDQALQIASSMEDFDVRITPQIVETLYKWTTDGESRLLVESWASKNHNEIWKNIDKNSLALVENGEDEFIASETLSLIKNN